MVYALAAVMALLTTTVATSEAVIVNIPLTYSRALCPEYTEASGVVRIDTASGLIDVTAHNLGELSADHHRELWLIENKPGAPNGVGIDVNDDHIVQFGPLSINGNDSFALSLDMLDQMQINAVAIVEVSAEGATKPIIVGLNSRPTTLFAAITRQANDSVKLGRKLFTQETFDGNGRTCATCHPLNKLGTLSASDIRRLPGSHKLFVHRQQPALADLEDDDLLTSRGLILENTQGFNNPPVFRSIPPFHNALSPFGWAGHQPSMAQFSMEAIVQHFPKTLNREPGVDFRMPTQAELDALAAFQLSVRNPKNRNLQGNLDRLVKKGAATRGREIFFDDERGKCARCHNSQTLGNTDNFDTGVEDRPDAGSLPVDIGDGGGAFNTPQLFGVGRKGIFFHNGTATTLREAVTHYTTSAFANSPSGQFLGGIDLDDNEISDIVAFLEAISRP